MRAPLSIRVLLAVVLLFPSASAFSATYTSNATGAWNVPTTWNPNGVPGAADSVTIQGAHTVTLDSARTIDSITVNGTLNLATFALNVTNTLANAGTISGAAPAALTSNGTFNWTGGTLNGTIIVTVAAGTSANLSGSTKTVQALAQLIVAGTANWTGGTITMNNGSLLTIQSGGIFDAQSDATINNTFGNGTINNAGTFKKTGGVAATTITTGVPFGNTGRLEVSSGKLDAQTLTLNTGSILGNGFTFGSGTTTIAGPSTVETGAAVTMGGGTLQGSSTLTVDGTLDWTGGQMNGGATVLIPAGKTSTINGAASKTLGTFFQLQVAGTLNWNDGTIIVNNSSLLNVQAGGLFNANGDDTITNTFGNGTVTNSGTFKKPAGTGTVTVTNGVPFNNSGRIEILTGNTDIQNLTLNAGSVIAGTNFTISSNSTLISGASSVEAGASMTLAGGTLGGSSTLTVNGTLHFTGGQMSGGATIDVPAAGTLNISGGATKTLGTNFDVNIFGTANWTGGTINVNNGSRLDVQTGGVFDAQSDNTINNTFGNGTISNNGTWRKSAGGASTTVNSGVPFTNNARIEVQSGILSIATLNLSTGTVIGGDGFTINTGTTSVTGTATVESGASMTLATGGTLGGNFSLTVDGTLEWTGGQMNGAGAATITSAGILSISGAASKAIGTNFALTIAGTVNWTDGSLIVNNGSLITIQPGGLFDVQNDLTIFNNFGNGTISNSGIFRKSSGSGAFTATSGVPFSTNGRIEILSGSSNIQTLTLNSGAVLAGPNFTLTSGTTTIAGPASVEAGATMTMSGGVLTGTSTLTILGTLDWTGGAMSGAGGNVLVPAGKTMTLSGATAKTLQTSFQLHIAGTANWTGGIINVNNSSLLDIQSGGLFDAKSDNIITNTFGNGTVSNSGTFRKSAGAGSTTVTSGVPFANDNRIEILTGTSNIQTLTLNAGSVIGGTGFTISSGTTTLAGPATVESTATATLSGGTINGASSLTVNGVFQWTGGQMNSVGSVIVAASGTMNISGAVGKTIGGGFDLVNNGTIDWTGTGNLNVNNSSLVNNQSGGLFLIRTDAAITNSFGNGTVTNAGTFRKTTATGTTPITSAVPFSNSGTIDLQTGALQLTNPTFTGTTILNFGIAGTTPLTQFGRLAVTNAVTFNGTIDVELLGGYSPLEGDQFAVITYTSRSGTLSESLAFESGRTFTTTYNPTNLTLTASCSPANPNVTPSATSFCTGDSVTLTSAPTGGTAPYSYQWFNGATLLNGETSSTLIVTAGGTYSVIVTDAVACASQSPGITITENAAPAVAISGPASACANVPFTLDAGPGFSSYSWSSGQTTRTINVSQTASTTYTVTVSNGGCPASDSHVVAIAGSPVATITAPASVPPGSSNTASVPAQDGASYTWTISNGAITAGQGTPQISFSAPASGTIAIGVTVVVDGCSAAGNATVEIVSADLAVEKSGPATVETGAAIDYTITITNLGPADASGVSIFDDLPPDTTLAGIAPGPWNCVTFTRRVVCTGDALAGSSSSIRITLTAPQQPGTITNQVYLASETADPDSSNDFDDVTTTVTELVTCTNVPPALLAPADGGPALTSPVTFSWSDVGALTYEVWIASGNAPTLLGTTANTSLTAPVESGEFRWYVVARFRQECDSLVSAERRLTVRASDNCALNPAPKLTAPAPGSIVDTPATFAWTAVAGALGYRLWIEVNGGAPQDIGATDGELTLSAELPPGEIVAFVDAQFSGCPPARSQRVAFTVPALNPCDQRATATPLSPADDAVLQSSRNKFEWAPAARADGYRLWASIDGAAAEVLGTTSTETSLVANIERGTVTWWVEALYDGCASTESAHFGFVIPEKDNCSTNRPTTSSPAAGAVVSNPNVTFTWEAVEGAIGYQVLLGVANGTATLIGTTEAGVTSLTHAVPAGALQWGVIALRDRCPSRESQKASFTYAPPPACDGNQSPVLTSPLEGIESTSPVDFVWNEPTGATKFELYAARGNAAPTLIATTTAGAASDISLAEGSLRWFVRAYFGDECSPLDSSERELTIVPTPAACGELSAPIISAPGEISSGVPFLLQWTPIAGATVYQVQVDGETLTLSDTSLEITRTNEGAEPIAVFARVRAIDGRCTPLPAVSLYGPTSAVFILPEVGTLGSVPLGDATIVQYTIELGPELAGQTFTAVPTEPWLSVTPASGVVRDGGITLLVQATTETLPVGTSLGAINVTLSGTTLSSNATSVSTPISVNLVTPISPAPKNTPPPDAMIIPAVASASGINAQFQSDVRVSNTSPQKIKYQLTFVPSGEAGIAAGKQTTFSIEPGRTIALDDILATWFASGTANAVGSLEIRPLTATQSSTSSKAVGALANIVSFASSRTFNATPNGTFGQYIPAVPFANFLAKAGAGGLDNVLSLQQISQSNKFRTNVGFVEGSGEKAELLVKVIGSNGQQLGSFPVTLNGGQFTQLNLHQQGFALEDGRLEVQVVSGSGKITAYASVLDNATGDAVLVTPVTLSQTGNTKWVVPGVADIATGFANWKTDMRVFNAGTAPVNVTASFHSQNGGAPKVAELTVDAGEVKQLDKVLSSLFHVTSDGGAVHLSTESAARLIATARTYNETSTGSYGLFASAVTPQEAVGVGSRPLQLLQVEESSRFRSNIGFAEVTGNPVTLEVTVVPPDAKFSAIVEVKLAANEFRQYGSLLASLGLGETHNARISVRAIEGAGRATAYAAVIDMKTNDPTYVPAQ